jgi:hypothetical protein
MKVSFGFGGIQCINGRHAPGVDLYFYTVFGFAQHPNEKQGLEQA